MMHRSGFRTLLLLLLLRECANAQFRFSVSTLPPSSGTNVPSPRADHLTVVVQSRDGFLVLVFGGRDATGAKSDTWTYLVTENRWTLLAAPALAENNPPPAMYGAVGGYRFLDGQAEFPFLYVTLGRLHDGTVTNEMWVMELETFTWRRVKLDGDIPSPRWGALGSLESFVKPDGSVQPALIVSHGRDEDGPLSDTYKCSFHSTDPYRATWRKIHEPVGQYSTRAPHPVWMHSATFTPARDVVMFGGCYASDKHGGICPSRDTWLLEYDPEKTSDIDTADVETSAESIPEFMPETDAVRWQKLPRGPPPRVGAAMAQGLNSFEDAYSGQRDIAILYSGSQRTDDLPSDQVMTMPHFDGGVVDIVSTTSRAWLHERVHYVGPEKQRQKTLDRRKGATLNAVRDVTSEETDIDQPSEYYLVFGGEFEDGSFTNALLKLSFDAFVESELIEDETPYTTRPMIHGILMFLSWGILMVIGTFSSRFAKDKEGKSRFFVVHVFVQLVALVLAWAGAGIAIYGRRRSNSSFAHGKIGLVALFLASFQPIMAVIGILLRLRNASSEIENRAKLSERLFPRICLFYHRTVGMAIIVLAAVNVTLGLFLIVAPATLWIQWIVYACLVFIAGLILEVIGGRRAGPDHMHAKVPSVNQGGISGGSSYPSCVVQSLKGESTADMLRRSTSSFGNRNKPAADEIPAENVSKGEETPWNGSQVGASFSSYSAQEKGTEHMEDALEQQLTELGVHFRNTGASQFSMRERLDSGTSLMSVYQDPDSY